MSLQSDVLKREFDKLSDDLTKKYDTLGMRASGNWDKEKTVEVKERGAVVNAKIIGEKYTEQLQFGRKPGGFPPIDALIQWIIDKRITFDIPIRSLAFLIGRKIAKEGWKREKHGGVNLVDLVATDELFDDIISQVGLINVKGIVKGLVTKLKTV